MDRRRVFLVVTGVMAVLFALVLLVDIRTSGNTSSNTATIATSANNTKQTLLLHTNVQSWIVIVPLVSLLLVLLVAVIILLASPLTHPTLVDIETFDPEDTDTPPWPYIIAIGVLFMIIVLVSVISYLNPQRGTLRKVFNCLLEESLNEYFDSFGEIHTPTMSDCIKRMVVVAVWSRQLYRYVVLVRRRPMLQSRYAALARLCHDLPVFRSDPLVFTFATFTTMDQERVFKAINEIAEWVWELQVEYSVTARRYPHLQRYCTGIMDCEDLTVEEALGLFRDAPLAPW